MMMQQLHTAIVLTPKSVIPSWERELKNNLQIYLTDARIEIIDASMKKKQRTILLQEIENNRHNRHVIIMSHHLLLTMVDEVKRITWDCVVLDEGHIIKNTSTKMSQAMHQLPSPFRLLLSGTPIQNDFREFWALVHWATQGSKLGSEADFRKHYADPILKGQDPHAGEKMRAAAADARSSLIRAIRPILLRRKKQDQRQHAALQLPEKKELVLWIRLSTKQREKYHQYISSSHFAEAMRRATYPVEVINTLKTICRHPVLVQNAEKLTQDVDSLEASMSKLGLQSTVETVDDDDVSPSQQESGSSYAKGHYFDILGRVPSKEELLAESTKLRVLVKMTSRLVKAGHRVLIFSQSKRMLDVIQYLFVEYSYPCFKIDGSTSSEERQYIIDEFNNLAEEYSGPCICLLTTKACGVGINLIGADRVIIFDPSWNPAEDSQAVDRAYRIGQTKPVIVYRLIHASCVEEKVYQKQVFKEGLRVISEKGNETKRYFSEKSEMRELLALGHRDAAQILKQVPNQLELLQIDHVHGLDSVIGCTRHDRLYREDAQPAAPLSDVPSSSSLVEPEVAFEVVAPVMPRKKKMIVLSDSEDESSSESESDDNGHTEEEANAGENIVMIDDQPMDETQQDSRRSSVIDMTQSEDVAATVTAVPDRDDDEVEWQPAYLHVPPPKVIDLSDESALPQVEVVLDGDATSRRPSVNVGQLVDLTESNDPAAGDSQERASRSDELEVICDCLDSIKQERLERSEDKTLVCEDSSQDIVTGQVEDLNVGEESENEVGEYEALVDGANHDIRCDLSHAEDDDGAHCNDIGGASSDAEDAEDVDNDHDDDDVSTVALSDSNDNTHEEAIEETEDASLTLENRAAVFGNHLYDPVPVTSVSTMDFNASSPAPFAIEDVTEIVEDDSENDDDDDDCFNLPGSQTGSRFDLVSMQDLRQTSSFHMTVASDTIAMQSDSTFALISLSSLNPNTLPHQQQASSIVLSSCMNSDGTEVIRSQEPQSKADVSMSSNTVAEQIAASDEASVYPERLSSTAVGASTPGLLSKYCNFSLFSPTSGQSSLQCSREGSLLPSLTPTSTRIGEEHPVMISSEMDLQREVQRQIAEERRQSMNQLVPFTPTAATSTVSFSNIEVSSSHVANTTLTKDRFRKSLCDSRRKQFYQQQRQQQRQQSSTDQRVSAATVSKDGATENVTESLELVESESMLYGMVPVTSMKTSLVVPRSGYLSRIKILGSSVKKTQQMSFFTAGGSESSPAVDKENLFTGVNNADDERVAQSDDEVVKLRACSSVEDEAPLLYENDDDGDDGRQTEGDDEDELCFAVQKTLRFDEIGL